MHYNVFRSFFYVAWFQSPCSWIRLHSLRIDYSEVVYCVNYLIWFYKLFFSLWKGAKEIITVSGMALMSMWDGLKSWQLSRERRLWQQPVAHCTVSLEQTKVKCTLGVIMMKDNLEMTQPMLFKNLNWFSHLWWEMIYVCFDLLLSKKRERSW